jgi:rhomboid family GlyGly-CTERM serine protease
MPCLEVAEVGPIIANDPDSTAAVPDATGRQAGSGPAVPGAGWYRRHVTPVLMLALIWLAAAAGQPLALALRYERGAISAGQWWRLVTAHWVHLGAWHALLDSVGLRLLWALYGPVLRARGTILALLASTVAVDAGLWFLQPALQWYEGISGLLHGLWAAGALLALWRRVPMAWMPAALLVGKLVHEALGGPSVASDFMPVVTVAHLYGAAGGLAAGLASMLAVRVRGSRYNPPPIGSS